MQYKKKSKGTEHLVYGVYPVIEALEAGRSLERVMISRAGTHDRIRDIRAGATAAGVPVQIVPDDTLQRICPDANHQGVVAVAAAITYYPLEETLLRVIDGGFIPFFILLDGITDVRNFGAIARTAECMGAHAIIVPDKGAAAGNADAVKVSSGALNHLPVCRVPNLVDALLVLQAYGVQTVAITEKANESIYQADLKGPRCLILGSEESGVSPALLKRADALIQIPMQGYIASLNVSVAAGIAMSEVMRQRSHA
jgi:23S rRNA (guanosine2251-2'-O)-methyltransferase